MKDTMVRFANLAPAIKLTYVVGCYSPVNTQDKSLPFVRDGNRQRVCLFKNKTELCKTKEDKPMFCTRKDARLVGVNGFKNTKTRCDKVWKVLANTFTGRIVEWVQKNP